MRYHAFISYSQAADKRLASDLQPALHRIAKPWYRKRALRVFRDITSLGATAELGTKIEHALAESAHFILLASPGAAASAWVRKEVDWWLDHRPIERFLVVLTEGGIAWDEASGDFDWRQTTALPDNLRGRFRREPLHVDLRWARNAEALSLRHRKLADAVATLAAPLHGKDKDELTSEDARQHRRTRAIVVAAVLSIGLFAVAATWQAIVAEQRRVLALARQLAAQSSSYLDEQPDLALLLSLEANRRAVTPEVRASLLAAVQNEPQLVTLLHGPAGAGYFDLAFGPENRTLAAGGLYGQADLWDLPLRRRLRSINATIDNNTDRSVAIAPDGRSVAFGGYDGRIEIWDLFEGERRIGPIKAHDSHVSLAFSPDGARLASSSDGDQAAIWHMPQVTELRRIPDLPQGDPLFGPHGRRLAAQADGWVTIVDLDGGEAIRWQAVERPPVRYPTISPDGRILATVSANEHEILLWDAKDGRQLLPPLRGHSFSINALAFSPDGRRLVSAGDDNQIRIWDLKDPGGEPQAMQGHIRGINSLEFSADGRLLASASDRIMLTDLTREHRIARRLGASGERAGRIALVADSSEMLSVGDAGLLLWNLSDPSRPPRQISRPRGGWSLAIAPDGRMAAWGGGNDEITLWDLGTGHLVQRIETGYRFNMGDIAFSRDGRILASTGNDGVHLWKAATGDPLGVELAGHDQWVKELAFTPDGTIMTSGGGGGGGGGGGVILWDTSTWRELGRIRESAQASAFSPDGSMLAIGYYQSMSLWDVARRRRLPIDFRGHSGSVNAFAFDARGELLASAGSDGDILLWHIPTGQRLGRLEGRGGRIFDLAFDPAGQRLVSAGNGGILVWNLSPESWKRIACRVANRDLSKDEWRRFLPGEPYARTCSDSGMLGP